MNPSQAEIKQGIKELIAAKINDGSIEEIVNKKIEEMTNDIVKSIMGNRVTSYFDKKGLTPENIHFGHFIEMVEELKLPIFEVKIYHNPFKEPETTISHECYKSFEDYAKYFSFYTFRYYDYERDTALGYKSIPDIFKGIFTIDEDGGSSTSHYKFVVTDFAILVHKRVDVWD